jgi:hypothetical protein
MHTAEPLVPEPNAFEVGMAIEKLKRQKSPDIDQIPPKLITAGGRTNRSEIHKLIRNRSTTDHIFCIRQILEKKLEYNEAVHQLFIDFKKAYD